MDIAQEMLTFNGNPDLPKKFITGDESWVYGYDSETKAQLTQLKRPEEKKARQVRSNVQVLVSVSFVYNAMGIMHQQGIEVMP